MSEEHSLEESVAKLGRLVPIIKDAHGNIIDGFHRQTLDPKWSEEFSIKLNNITDTVQLLLARMNINLCRRNVSAVEKTQWLKELKELTNWNPKEIAEKTGFSERWVYLYLPKETKQLEPEQLASARLALRPLVECSHCFMASRETTEYKGENLCPSCLMNAQQKPVVKPVPIVKKPEPTIIKPKDKWEHRIAHMKVPVSKMEQAVLVKLTEKGLHPEVQRQFCLQNTTPDYYFPQQNLAIYCDGEVHRGREDRDQTIRELLAKRHNVRVVTIPYEGSSEATEDYIVTQIMEAFRG